MPNIKERAAKGVFWNAVEQFCNNGIQFVVGLILARLLMPSDFGLIGMLTIFIALAQTFIDSGFSQALIQKKNPTDKDYSTVFWFNLLVSLLMYFLLAMTAPFIAIFFNEPVLTDLTRLLALNFVVLGSAAIHQTRFTQIIDFKSLAKVNMLGVFTGGVIGITMAFSGYGVWSLVTQTLTASSARAAGLWILGRWKPMFCFSSDSFKTLFSFGSKLLASSLLDSAFKNIYPLIIGKLFSAQSLGYFTNAQRIQSITSNTLYGVINKVTFPIFCELQYDKEKLKNAHRKFLRTASVIMFPAMAILGVSAYPAIKIILTDKWIPSVPILQILCIVGALYPLQAINVNILKAIGRSDLFFKLEIYKKILLIVVIVISYRWGVIGMVWGMGAQAIIALYINTYYIKKLLNYGLDKQLRDLKDIIAMAGVSMVVMICILYSTANIWLDLFLIPIAGTVIFLLCMIIFNKSEIDEVKLLIQNFLKNKGLDKKIIYLFRNS